MTRNVLVAIVLAVALGSVPAGAVDLPAARATYSKLLEKYVTPRGVRYTAWRSSGDDLKAISGVVASCRGVDTKDFTPEQRKALYIDLYNAKILEVVLQGNPKTSVKELSRGLGGSEIFARKMILLGGKGVSQNNLEEWLRKEYHDPRVHFALNRGARSSPPLRVEAYVSESIDAQLDDAVRTYLALPGSLVVKTQGGKTTITASKIFDWYAEDFKAGGGALAFIAKYGPPEAAVAAAAPGARLAFAEFDWSLNSAH